MSINLNESLRNGFILSPPPPLPDMHMNIQMHMLTCTCTHMHMYTHAHAHAHICICTHTMPSEVTITSQRIKFSGIFLAFWKFRGKAMITIAIESDHYFGSYDYILFHKINNITSHDYQHVEKHQTNSKQK